MNFLDRYKNRLGYNGSNSGESISNNSNDFIEMTFDESPTYRLADVISYEKPDITSIDLRVITVERLGSVKEVLFRPSSGGVGIGSYLVFDNDTWIIFDRFRDTKVLIQRCNNTLKWTNEDGDLISLPCVASASDLGSKAKQGRNELEWNKYDVTLPAGQLYVFVHLDDETSKINVNDRFIFGTKVYEVIGYDDVTNVDNGENGRFGILQLTIKLTTAREQDDFENQSPHDGDLEAPMDYTNPERLW